MTSIHKVQNLTEGEIRGKLRGNLECGPAQPSLFTILLTCLPLTRPQAHDEEEDDQSDEDGCPGDVDQPPYGGDGHSLHRLGLHQDAMD